MVTSHCLVSQQTKNITGFIQSHQQEALFLRQCTRPMCKMFLANIRGQHHRFSCAKFMGNFCTRHVQHTHCDLDPAFQLTPGMTKTNLCGAAIACSSAAKDRGAPLKRSPAASHRRCTRCFRVFCKEDCFTGHLPKCPNNASASTVTPEIDLTAQWLPLKSVGVKRGPYNTGPLPGELL